MKSILLYANQDEGMAQRLDAALCLSSDFDGQIDCVQITPYDAFIAADPFGGVYALPMVVEHVAAAEAKHREQVEGELRRARKRWSWSNFEGHAGHVLLERSRLADIVVVSLPNDRAPNLPLSIASDLAIHARAPVLALSDHGKAFSCDGEAMIAWNGSAECAHALRLAVPLLSRASAVTLVHVLDGPVRVPVSDAQHYLRNYGINVRHRELMPEHHNVTETLLSCAWDVGAHYIVAGAFGHSRFREAILGGVTRELIRTSTVPLLLTH
jgi:nucleotide-binding universal stress UspA family protein